MTKIPITILLEKNTSLWELVTQKDVSEVAKKVIDQMIVNNNN